MLGYWTNRPKMQIFQGFPRGKCAKNDRRIPWQGEGKRIAMGLTALAMTGVTGTQIVTATIPADRSALT